MSSHETGLVILLKRQSNGSQHGDGDERINKRAVRLLLEGETLTDS